jgi:hypothetical protein
MEQDLGALAGSHSAPAPAAKDLGGAAEGEHSEPSSRSGQSPTGSTASRDWAQGCANRSRGARPFRAPGQHS